MPDLEKPKIHLVQVDGAPFEDVQSNNDEDDDQEQVNSRPTIKITGSNPFRIPQLAVSDTGNQEPSLFQVVTKGASSNNNNNNNRTNSNQKEEKEGSSPLLPTTSNLHLQAALRQEANALVSAVPRVAVHLLDEAQKGIFLNNLWIAFLREAKGLGFVDRNVVVRLYDELHVDGDIGSLQKALNIKQERNATDAVKCSNLVSVLSGLERRGAVEHEQADVYRTQIAAGGAFTYEDVTELLEQASAEQDMMFGNEIVGGALGDDTNGAGRHRLVSLSKYLAVMFHLRAAEEGCTYGVDWSTLRMKPATLVAWGSMLLIAVLGILICVVSLNLWMRYAVQQNEFHRELIGETCRQLVLGALSTGESFVMRYDSQITVNVQRYMEHTWVQRRQAIADRHRTDLQTLTQTIIGPLAGVALVNSYVKLDNRFSTLRQVVINNNITFTQEHAAKLGVMWRRALNVNGGNVNACFAASSINISELLNPLVPCATRPAARTTAVIRGLLANLSSAVKTADGDTYGYEYVLVDASKRAAFVASLMLLTVPQVIAKIQASMPGANLQWSGSLSDRFLAKVPWTEVGVEYWYYSYPTLHAKRFRANIIDTVEKVNKLNTVLPGIIQYSLGEKMQYGDQHGADQVTAYNAPSSCKFGGMTPCRRIDVAQYAFNEATQNVSGVFNVDYRPQPVEGTFAFIGEGVDMVLLRELDLYVLRNFFFGIVTSIITSVNQRLPETMEVYMVQWNGDLPTPTFDPTALCEDERMCVRNADNGEVIFRYDCPLCVALKKASISNSTAKYATMRKFIVCESPKKGPNGTLIPVIQRVENDLLHVDCSLPIKIPPGSPVNVLLTEAPQNWRKIVATDYRRHKAAGVARWMPEVKSLMIVKQDMLSGMDMLEKPVKQIIGYCVLICVCGMLLLRLATWHALSHLELEWKRARTQLESEQSAFHGLMRDCVPVTVAERLLKGVVGNVVVEGVPHAYVAILDVSKFQAMTTGWDGKRICRTMSYAVMVIDAVANKYEIFKLRLAGDMYIAVSGLDKHHALKKQNDEKQKNRSGDDENDGEKKYDDEVPLERKHHSIRLGEFAAIVMQLFSPSFVHLPHTVPKLREAFRTVGRKAATVMPSLRVGMHVGPCAVGTVDIGTAPHFDCLGSAISVTTRVVASSLPNRVNVSLTLRDAIKAHDEDELYSFEGPRRVATKGQGAMQVALMRSVSCAVPQEVLKSLGALEAESSTLFGEAEKGRRKGRDDFSDASSVATRSTLASTVMSNDH